MVAAVLLLAGFTGGFALARMVVRLDQVVREVAAPVDGQIEIGRASCRERVLPTV